MSDDESNNFVLGAIIGHMLGSSGGSNDNKGQDDVGSGLGALLLLPVILLGLAGFLVGRIFTWRLRARIRNSRGPEKLELKKRLKVYDVFSVVTGICIIPLFSIARDHDLLENFPMNLGMQSPSGMQTVSDSRSSKKEIVPNKATLSRPHTSKKTPTAKNTPSNKKVAQKKAVISGPYISIGVHVYFGAGETTGVWGKIYENTRVKILSVSSSGWTKIEFQPDVKRLPKAWATGFVRKSDVKNFPVPVRKTSALSFPKPPVTQKNETSVAAYLCPQHGQIRFFAARRIPAGHHFG